MMRRRVFVTVIAFLMAGTSVASGEFVQGISIDFVTIDNPGNPGDTRTGTWWGEPIANPPGCGSVDYVYQIGKCEVTNAQWDAFVAVAGEPSGNPSSAYDYDAYWTGDNIPTNAVSWYESAQFCNYLTSGDKSQGAYQFSGDNTNPRDFEGIDRDSAVSTYGIVYVIPTEDEWYKAAYYSGSGYSNYANGTDNAPIEDVESNYGYPLDGPPWDVGTGTREQNGTFDMMGNVWEWNETLIDGSYRGLRGGSYLNIFNVLSSSCRHLNDPSTEYAGFGFRVAAVPEPATLLLLGLGGLFFRRRR